MPQAKEDTGCKEPQHAWDPWPRSGSRPTVGRSRPPPDHHVSRQLTLTRKPRHEAGVIRLRSPTESAASLLDVDYTMLDMNVPAGAKKRTVRSRACTECCPPTG
jgi:hypothetical protein